MLIVSPIPLLFERTIPMSCFSLGNSTLRSHGFRIPCWRKENWWSRFSKDQHYVGFWRWLPSEALTLLFSCTPIHARNCAIAPVLHKYYPSISLPSVHPQRSHQLHSRMGLQGTGKPLPSLTSVDFKNLMLLESSGSCSDRGLVEKGSIDPLPWLFPHWLQRVTDSCVVTCPRSLHALSNPPMSYHMKVIQ